MSYKTFRWKRDQEFKDELEMYASMRYLKCTMLIVLIHIYIHKYISHISAYMEYMYTTGILCESQSEREEIEGDKDDAQISRVQGKDKDLKK